MPRCRQVAREGTHLAGRQAVVVDEAEIERSLGLMKGQKTAFVARERGERAALKRLAEMLRDKEDAGDQGIAHRLFADTRNGGLIL